MTSSDDPAAIEVRLAADLTVIRPGDTILVRMHRDTPREQLLFVGERLRDRLPGVEVLMLPGAEGIEVYRPSAAAAVPEDQASTLLPRAWLHHCGHLNAGTNEKFCSGCRTDLKRASEAEVRYALVPVQGPPTEG